MHTMQNAMRAYASGASTRSLKDQEAELFRQVNAGLFRARDTGNELALVRAVADNKRLWLTIVGLVCDPANALPDGVRASLASIGMAVQREMQRDTPDLTFLIDVNENVAAGLSPR